MHLQVGCNVITVGITPVGNPPGQPLGGASSVPSPQSSSPSHSQSLGMHDCSANGLEHANSSIAHDEVTAKQQKRKGGYTRTVLPAKSDSDVMFYLQSYQGLIIDKLLVY